MIRLAQAIVEFSQPVPHAFAQSDDVCVMDFGSVAMKSQTVPAEASFVRIGTNGAVFVNLKGDAALTAGDVTYASASEQVRNKGLYSLGGATAVSVAAVTTCLVTLAFYA